MAFAEATQGGDGAVSYEFVCRELDHIQPGTNWVAPGQMLPPEFNYTCNVRHILLASGSDLFVKGEVTGEWNAHYFCTEVLTTIIPFLMTDEAEALNPDNGWGDVKSLAALLSLFVSQVTNQDRYRTVGNVNVSIFS